jgi:hypothetical protein
MKKWLGGISCGHIWAELVWIIGACKLTDEEKYIECQMPYVLKMTTLLRTMSGAAFWNWNVLRSSIKCRNVGYWKKTSHLMVSGCGDITKYHKCWFIDL